METGIELIAQERKEQIEKHNRSINSDIIENPNGELIQGARALTVKNLWKPEYEKAYILNGMPNNWNSNLCVKMAEKPYKERLIIAGALIAAELDRLNSVDTAQVSDRTTPNSNP